MDKFFIWSVKHGLWWGPDHAGYEPTLDKAGTYTEAECDEIERRSQFAGQFSQISVRIPLKRLPTTRHSFLTHGRSADCPQVLNGAWDYCKGHDSSRMKCVHGVDKNMPCRLCDPTLDMSPRQPVTSR